MQYRAEVTLQCDPIGLHTRPIAEVTKKLENIRAATIVFHRDNASVEIDLGSPMLSLMEAAGTLNLGRDSQFMIECGGDNAPQAFQALQEAFTTGYFEGSEFRPLDPA